MQEVNNGADNGTARPRALACLVTAAFLWSLGGLLIKMISLPPMAIAGTRSAIAALLFLAVLRRPKLRLSLPLIGGALAYAATVILFVTATKMTTAANAILLQYTAPVYVAVFGAWYLKERVGLADWLTIFAVIAGMVLFFFDNLSPGNVTGNVFAVLSGVSFAIMVIFLRKQKDESPLESIFFGNILTFLIALPFIAASPPGRQDLALLLVLGVFQLGASYILYTAAIKHVTALEGTLIPVIEPVFNPIWVFLVIGEVPGPWALVGGIIVLTAVTVRCIPSEFRTRCFRTALAFRQSKQEEKVQGNP